MPIASLGDVELSYEITGSGPPLILVSGLAGLASYWDPNIVVLSEHHTVLRFDHRGTGSSTRWEGCYSIELLADDLVRLMDVLDMPSAALVGHSTGGAMGQVLAARHPERVDSLVLYATWATLCPQMRACMAIRRELLQGGGAAAFHRASPVFLYPPRYVCDHWERLEAGVAGGIAHSTTPSILDARILAVTGFDGKPYLGAIACPTLVLVAADDILTPPLASDELVEGIARAELNLLPGGAHAASICEPDLFNTAVLGFLSTAAGSVSAWAVA